MTHTISYYDNLQVTRGASSAVIRAAYKTLAQKFHPDRFTDSPVEAERVMKLLNEAYSVLSVPERRKRHDEWLNSQTIEEKAAMAKDEREICGSCGKRMVPRIITGPPLFNFGPWTPVPKSSVCPYCGKTHKEFASSRIGIVGRGVAVALLVVFAAALWRGSPTKIGPPPVRNVDVTPAPTPIIPSVIAAVTATEVAPEPKVLTPAAVHASARAPVPAPVSTGTKKRSENAAPLGVEIGMAHWQDVQASLGRQTHLEPNGTNHYTGGDMFVSNGDGLGVEGLTRLVLIFDRDEVLVGMIMTLRKDPKDAMAKLAAKYRVVSNRIDSFMNYGYAKLVKGDSVIEIDSPHLSFTMQVNYMTNDFASTVQRQDAEEGAQKRRDQIGRL